MKRVEITFGFWSVICVLAWLDMRMCLRFLLAVAFHEMGHLMTMVLTGVPVYAFRLKATGAVIRGGFTGYGQEMVCALAGPFSSFLLGFVCMRYAPKLALISCLLGAMNLLPVYPLDGGRILRSVLLLCTSEDKADRILRIVTATVCCGLMVCACWTAVELQAGLWPVFASLVILWRVGQAGWQEQQKPVAFPADRS